MNNKNYSDITPEIYSLADKCIKNSEDDQKDQQIGCGCEAVRDALNTENDQRDHTEQMQDDTERKRHTLCAVDTVDGRQTQCEEHDPEGQQKRRTEKNPRQRYRVLVVQHVKVDAVRRDADRHHSGKPDTAAAEICRDRMLFFLRLFVQDK